jgi:hypothetical protein
VPYGTDSRWNGSQAINCLATIIQSLRDGALFRTDSSSERLSGLATITEFLRDHKPYPRPRFRLHIRGNSRSRTRTACPTKLLHDELPLLFVSEVGTTRRERRASGQSPLLPLRFEIGATDLENDRIGRFYQDAFAWYCAAAALREFRNRHIRMANRNLLNCRRCDP